MGCESTLGFVLGGLVVWVIALVYWTMVLFGYGIISLVGGGNQSGDSPAQIPFNSIVFYCVFLTFHMLALLVVRITLEACVALFDISNTLKQIAKR